MDSPGCRAGKGEFPYGNTIAHGFLTLSLLGHLSNQCLEIRGDFKLRINYGLNRVRFSAPVLAGTRIRPRFTLRSMEEIDGGCQLAWAVTMDAENTSKPVLYAEWLVRLYR
jgi:acyl dehydratase